VFALFILVAQISILALKRIMVAPSVGERTVAEPRGGEVGKTRKISARVVEVEGANRDLKGRT